MIFFSWKLWRSRTRVVRQLVVERRLVVQRDRLLLAYSSISTILVVSGHSISATTCCFLCFGCYFILLWLQFLFSVCFRVLPLLFAMSLFILFSPFKYALICVTWAASVFSFQICFDMCTWLRVFRKRPLYHHEVGVRSTSYTPPFRDPTHGILLGMQFMLIFILQVIV